MTNTPNEEDYSVDKLTNDQLTDFISDLKDSNKHLKDVFAYDEHVGELINRAKKCRMLTRLDIFKAMNTIDKSFDSVPEELYVVDVNELLDELGL